MSDLRSKFLEVYEILKSELLNDPAFEWTQTSRQWVERVLLNFFYFTLFLIIFTLFYEFCFWVCFLFWKFLRIINWVFQFN